MTRCNLCLWGLALLLGGGHLGYSVLERFELPQGAHFSSGVALLGNGAVLTLHSRLQFQADGVYDFQQSNIGHTREFFRQVADRLLGNLRLVTVSSRLSETPLPAGPGAEELAFNHAYYSKKGAPLTLYRLPVGEADVCFYILELHKLRCLSTERARSLPPL